MGYPFRYVLGVARDDKTVASPVHYQCRRLNALQHRPHVSVLEQIADCLEIPAAPGESLTAAIPAPLCHVPAPARRKQFKRRTGPRGLAENVGQVVQGPLRNGEWLIGRAQEVRVRAPQDKRTHPLGMACRQQHGRKRRSRHPKHRSALAACRVEHRDQSVRPCLHRRTLVDRHRIGAATPSRSVRINRPKEASRRRWSATVWSSQIRSMGNLGVGTNSRSGPELPAPGTRG